MSKIIQNINIGLDESLTEKLDILMPNHGEYRILRESVDARKKTKPHLVYTLEVADKDEKLSSPNFNLKKVSKKLSQQFLKPIIIGSGPAGLFAALRFVERGIPCILFERGSQSSDRIKGINQYWRYGKLDRRNNVCYGEGGAGLYSDGKLITRIKSEHIPYVLNQLVRFGAPAEIEYLSNPHVGSDRIRRVIPHLREYLKSNGCEIHFDTQITKILHKNNHTTGVETEYGKIYHSNHVILATGHSAEDMIYHLAEEGVFIEGKSFAMGLRIEHPQSLINKIQYRDFADHPKLGSANYKLAHHDHSSQVGVYSFCMCPGGYILSSGTEEDRVVSNGMSNYKRNSPFANAAIVVSVNHSETKTLFDSFIDQCKLIPQEEIKDLLKKSESSVFSGLALRHGIERLAFSQIQKNKGTKELPGQKVIDFLNKKTGILYKHSIPSGAMSVDFNQLLPKMMSQRIAEGLEKFNTSMKGFTSEHAQLFGVETRTSCPVRITRNEETLESLSHKGLYPCGEGAGYAGGITSAACDGIKVAEAIISQFE